VVHSPRLEGGLTSKGGGGKNRKTSTFFIPRIQKKRKSKLIQKIKRAWGGRTRLEAPGKKIHNAKLKKDKPSGIGGRKTSNKTLLGKVC